MTYTSEEKQEYFKQLRERWSEAKKLSETDEKAKVLYQQAGGKISYISFYLTLIDMRHYGYDGLPYIDCKTYDGWKKSGFKVKKGEHSKIGGITWISPKNKDGEEEEDPTFIYPKSYNLFHKSQVEPL